MAIYTGRVSEIRLGSGGELEGHVSCPPAAVPAAGRYLSAYAPREVDAALGTPLLLAQVTGDGFWAAPPFPPSWAPGTELGLRGPLGRGFDLPQGVTRLALAALGSSPARALPLALEALHGGCAVALFSDVLPSSTPASLEIYPLAALCDFISWPGLLAMDIPIERLPALRGLLGVRPGDPLPCAAQALVWTPMPCAGMAECGACAVPARRGYKLACADGPVFPLSTLEW